MIYFSGGTDNPYNYNGIGYNGVPAEPSPVTFAFSLRSGEVGDHQREHAESDHGSSRAAGDTGRPGDCRRAWRRDSR